MLGSFSVTLADRQPPNLRRKTRALLAYLVAIEQKHSRRHLMTLFCAEAKDPPAVLRSLLSRLRRNVAADILLIDGEQIGLDHSKCWVDCLTFSTAFSSSLTALANDELTGLLDLYRGEFLEEMSLADAPEFELWLLGERARYRALYERGLTTAVTRLTNAGAWNEAIGYAQKLVAENPLLEEAHGRLIWLYSHTGQLRAAQAQYQQCRDLLATELAVEPTAELQQLYADIQAGKARPQFEQLAPQPAQLSPLSEQTLIGREAEIAQLELAWQNAQLGKGQVILVEAEAGGGKTHLVQLFGRRLDPTQFLYGEGYESAQTIPYSPWLELLEMALAPFSVSQLANLPHNVRTAIAQLIPEKSQLSEATSLPTERLFAALAAFLLQDRPRFLFIDNLQWADAATLNLFHFLARRVAQAPVVLVGAYRPALDNQALVALLDDLHRQSATRLLLPSLTTEKIVSLLAAQWPSLPEDSQPETAAILQAATAGNPLFLTEIIRELAHTTAVPQTIPVPPSVLDLIMRRLRHFSASVRQVIESLAVLHAPASPELLQKISGRSEEETAVAVEIALQQGVVAPHEGDALDLYDFHHDLMREAVALLLSNVRRRLLHKRTAKALQPTAKAAVLAYHWQKAGDTDQEAIYAAQAGGDAYAVYANDDAERYLQRAIDLNPQSATWRQLGQLWQRVGKWEEAEKAFEEAEQLSADEAERATVQFAQGLLAWQRGSNEVALSFFTVVYDYFHKLPPQPDAV